MSRSRNDNVNNKGQGEDFKIKLILIMSTTCVAISLLIFLTVLSTLSFTQGSTRMEFRQDEASKLFEEDDADADESDRSNSRVDRSVDSVDPKRSFLAGEDTPVWVAYYADPKNKDLLSYRKLEKGIVKQAIDHWKSNEFHGTSKGKRSVDCNTHLLKGDRESFTKRVDMNDAGVRISHVTERPKREANRTVYHPSVLAIMEYGKTWPLDEQDERNVILDRIIYALAYWNSVDIQLRPIENPWIRLRLAGIVIGRDRDATHHLFEIYSDEDYLHYEGTLHRMGEYWGDKMRQKIDFQRGTYNIVALMTDAKQVPKRKVDAASANLLPCNRDNPGATGVLITYDNLKFSGLQKTLQHTARILGHGSDNDSSCLYTTNWDSRHWGPCNLNSIRKSLDSKGWCMKEPQEFHDPGKPVEIILPGSLISWDEQCNTIASGSGNSCPGSSCRSLHCQTIPITGFPCEFWHAAMDGSPCGTEKICVNGECVPNTRLVNDWWMDNY